MNPSAFTPDQLQVAAERELGRRSLARFVQLAWHQIEPQPLIWSWHMGAICDALTALYKREIRNLVICVPPGHSKSLLVSTFGPAWQWIQDPTTKFIACTYDQTLSEKNARLQRDLVASPWFRDRWGDIVSLSNREEAKVRLFANGARGWRFSTSIAGGVLGRHADCLIGDDLVSADDAEKPEAHEDAASFWFTKLATRQADPKRTIRVMIAQRLHEADVPGQCIERGYHALVLPLEYDPRKHCSIPAIKFTDPRTVEGQVLDPERVDAEALAQLKTMTPLAYSAQCQQSPVPPSGLIWQRDWWTRRWTEEPPRTGRILTVDASFKDLDTSDEVAITCATRTGAAIPMLDQRAGRWDILRTMEQIASMREKWGATGVYVEDKANGSAILSMMRRHFPGFVEWQPGRSSKVDRARATVPEFQAGNVQFPPEHKAPWWAPLVDQAMKFPRGKHDDRVDSAVMAVLILADVGNFTEMFRKAMKNIFARPALR